MPNPETIQFSLNPVPLEEETLLNFTDILRKILQAQNKLFL